MTYSQPTFSSLQKMKGKSTQSRSVCDLPEVFSHPADAAHGHVSADSNSKRNSLHLSATLQGPLDQPDLWYLSNTDDSAWTSSKGKDKVITPVEEEFDIAFAEPATLPPLQPTIFEYPNLKTWSVDVTESTANNNRRGPQTDSRQSLDVSTSSMRTSFSPPAKQGRYYSHALSDQDTQALAVGEKNHNLQLWSPQNLVNHHESRKELVPLMLNKVDKTEALASIEYDKQSAQRNALNAAPKVRGLSRLPNLTVPSLANIDKSTEYNSVRPLSYRQATHSMVDVRSSGAPPQRQSMPSLGQSDATGPGLTRYSNANTRAASTSEHFARPSTLLPATPPPSSLTPASSRSSNHGRSPLGQPPLEAFQVNPNATFDAFLVPHKSGKGEVHVQSPQAQKLSLDGSPISSRRKHLSNKVSSLFSRKRGASKLRITDTVPGTPEDSPALPARRFSWQSEHS